MLLTRRLDSNRLPLDLSSFLAEQPKFVKFALSYSGRSATQYPPWPRTSLPSRSFIMGCSSQLKNQIGPSKTKKKQLDNSNWFLHRIGMGNPGVILFSLVWMQKSKSKTPFHRNEHSSFSLIPPLRPIKSGITIPLHFFSQVTRFKYQLCSYILR